MSASFEAAASAATVSQGDSSPENRIPVSAAQDGDGRLRGRPASASGSQSADSQLPGKERPAYLIKWSRFEEQLSNAFAELFCSEHFADVTLACDGGDVLKAHKIILAMSSPFFRRIFIDTPCKHPIVVLKEFSATVMRNILQYLYMGKVILGEHEISGFMDAADFFGICGIIPDQYSCDIFATTIPEPDQRLGDDKDEQSEEKIAKTNENEEVDDTQDSQSMMQDDERTIISHSPVIKYHGIKARWNRRYSNTSFPGVPNITSTNVKEHKRSASAGEVESVPRLEPLPQVGERVKTLSPQLDESQSQPLSDVEIISGGDNDRFEEPPTGLQEMEDRQRRIIQRTYAKVYSGTARILEDNSDTQFDEWKHQVPIQSTYIPPNTSTTSTQRTSRPSPYVLGAKDFSHPLQVNVESPKQVPLYGVSSASAGMINPMKSKPHSEFTMSASSHSSQPQMRTMFRPEPQTEFPSTSSAMPLLTSHDNDQRSSFRYRQLSSGSSTATSPTTAYRSHEYSPRPHFSLLSQGWPFQDGHHRHRHHLEDSTRGSIERRFRSDSLERGLGPFSNASHLRGMAAPTAADLSQQYALGFIPQLRSPSSSGTGTSVTRPKTKAIRSSQVPQSSRYTAQEVDSMVDAVANYPGNIVPCTLCQKFVKRERLRAHIHECHLLSGEKIICPHCGIALKSKGSFRVHIWRHKRGALPTRSTMSDFDGGRPPSPPPGPASH